MQLYKKINPEDFDGDMFNNIVKTYDKKGTNIHAQGINQQMSSINVGRNQMTDEQMLRQRVSANKNHYNELMSQT